MSGALRSTTCYNNNADADASASPLLRSPATSPRLPGRRSAAADACSMLLNVNHVFAPVLNRCGTIALLRCSIRGNTHSADHLRE